MPPGHSRVAGLNCLRDLEDDAIPLGAVTGDGAIRDGLSEALPHTVQIAYVTMRYPISTYRHVSDSYSLTATSQPMLINIPVATGITQSARQRELGDQRDVAPVQDIALRRPVGTHD